MLIGQNWSDDRADEEMNCKSLLEDFDALTIPAGELLLEHTRSNVELPVKCVPSLQSAIPELRKLESVLRVQHRIKPSTFGWPPVSA